MPEPNMSNAERALLGLPLLVRIVACCNGSRRCEFKDRIGELVELIRKIDPIERHLSWKNYVCIRKDKLGNKVEVLVNKIEVLP